MELTTKDLIEINKGILQEWIEENPKAYEGVAADESALKNILNAVSEQDSPILKAAHLMGRIAWIQPFAGGNKRTGIVSADTMLRMSGYRLIIEDEEDVEYIRKLLFEIQEERSVLNPETLAKIALYVSKRIRKL